MSLFEAQKRRTVNLSADAYLKLSESELKHVRRVEVIPAMLGRPGFGFLRVTYESNSFQVSEYERPTTKHKGFVPFRVSAT